MQKIKVEGNSRVETGVVKFNNDWPGIFIRGDDAFGYAMLINSLLEDNTALSTTIFLNNLESLRNLLLSCDASKEENR